MIYAESCQKSSRISATLLDLKIDALLERWMSRNFHRRNVNGKLLDERGRRRRKKATEQPAAPDKINIQWIIKRQKIHFYAKYKVKTVLPNDKEISAAPPRWTTSTRIEANCCVSRTMQKEEGAGGKKRERPSKGGKIFTWRCSLFFGRNKSTGYFTQRKTSTRLRNFATFVLLSFFLSLLSLAVRRLGKFLPCIE